MLNRVGDPLAIETLDLVEPGAGEVRVRIVASGICHSDLRVVCGEWKRNLPVVLGHEGAGVVDAVGPGVTGLVPGDHVVLSWTPFCGRCVNCVTGRPVLCQVAETTRGTMSDRAWRLSRGGEPVFSGAGVGAFAEYTVVPETGAIKVRPDAPFEIGAIVGCAVMTGVGAVINTAGIRPGQSVAIIGGGGVGLSAVLGAKLVSAGKIIAVDVVKDKLTLAQELGATHAINARETDVVDEIRKITGGAGVDYALEAVGNARTIEVAYGSLAPGGTVVVVGQVSDKQMITIDPMRMSDRELTITGSNYGSARPTIDIPMLLDLYASGALDLSPLVTATLGISDINDGLAELARGRGVRSVILEGL